MSDIKCPICLEGEMKYTQQGNTHIWSCVECPTIVIEYYGSEDYDNLGKYLGEV